MSQSVYVASTQTHKYHSNVAALHSKVHALERLDSVQVSVRLWMDIIHESIQLQTT